MAVLYVWIFVIFFFNNFLAVLGKAGPAKSVTDCVFRFNSLQKKNGSFSSPRYPQPYPAPAACRYSFQGQTDERVVIEFKTMDLNYPDGEKYDPFDCIEVDAVTISVPLDHAQRNVGTYCGSRLPPNLMSPGDRMDVLFVSKSMSSCKGFLAEFRFVKNFGITTGKQKKSECYFEYHSIEASNGTFSSPNHPGYYPKNTECHYLFFGKEDEKVHIQFPVFDVEGIPPLCLEKTQSDYVEFSNFQVPLLDRKMDRYCGTSEAYQRKEIGSDGSFFRVAFKSNDIYDATGFSAFYQFRPVHGAHSYIHLLPKTGGPTSSKNSNPSHNKDSQSCKISAVSSLVLFLCFCVTALLP